jgi:hypothetical protein
MVSAEHDLRMTGHRSWKIMQKKARKRQHAGRNSCPMKVQDGGNS